MSARLPSKDLSCLSCLAQRDWVRGQDALSFLSQTISTKPAHAVSNGIPKFANSPCWERGLDAMKSAFGFDLLHHHMFHADPLDWLQMTETQATGGLAWFLNAEDRTVRNGRIRAMLRALGRDDHGCSSGGIHDANATNEDTTSEGKRIDLLLTWRNALGECCGAVIEAKFSCGNMKNPLPAYQAHLMEMIDSGGSEKPLLFIVSSQRGDKIDQTLAHPKNTDWRWISWYSLLLAFDCALAPEHDDGEFRQFRRTLWECAGP